MPVTYDEFLMAVESHHPGGVGFALLEATARQQNYRWVKQGVWKEMIPAGTPDDREACAWGACTSKWSWAIGSRREGSLNSV